MRTRLTGIGLAITAIFCVSGAAARAASYWVPPQQLTWYWQLTGSPKVEPVQATDIDGFDNSAGTVAAFHARGQRVICYIDVGTWENWRSDAGSFPSSVLGNTLDGYANERWLDVSQLSTLEPIMLARFRLCQQKGFDAVEPDNIDGYENDPGFSISAAQQLAYDEWVATAVHSLGMAVLEKNDPDQAGQLEPYFDGVLDEQCNQYSQCSAYQPYISAGKPVLNAEYQSSLYPGFCTSDNAGRIMGALFDLALDGATYQPCFGPSITTPITSGGGTPPLPTTGGGTTGGGTTGGGTTGGGTPPAGKRRSALDRTAPRIVIAAGSLRDQHGIIHVVLSCPSGQSYCAGKLTVVTVSRYASSKHGARVQLSLGGRTFHIKGGRRAKVGIGLSAAALRKLVHLSSLSVLLQASARDAAGHKGSSKRKVELKL